jgi:SAM-dependent methyltransferase
MLPPATAKGREKKTPEQFAYTLLAYPNLYNSLMSSIGGPSARNQFINTYVRPKAQDKILDIGCGTGKILDYLPQCHYVGIDIEQKYIEHAKSQYGNRGIFLCNRLDKFDYKELNDFDIVIASGLLHHLDDQQAESAIKLARYALKPKGRLVTLDGCYLKYQSPVARFLLSLDRGRHVRTVDSYNAIIQGFFDQIDFHILHNMLRIPYTHVIFECSYT